ncbi:MAG: DUF1735 and LamG domain-containing protein [Bacteroidales bacterium]|nr:DUF1735 and LamG domain-containing protein [Bacteroidales bacterium]
MKQFFKYASIGLSMALLAGCNDEKLPPIVPSADFGYVYLSEAAPASQHNQQMETFILDEATVTKTLTAKLTNAISEDVTVSFSIDESLLESYNQENDSNYQIYPVLSLGANGVTTAVIKAGTTSAAPVELTVEPGNGVQGVAYAIPVRMELVSGPAEMRGNANKMTYFITSPNKQRAPVFRRQNSPGTIKTFGDFQFSEWTMEFWVKVNTPPGYAYSYSPDTWVGEAGNPFENRRAIFVQGGYSPVAINKNTELASFNFQWYPKGALDATQPGMQWNYPSLMSTTGFWIPDTWIHIALTFDGSTMIMYKDGAVDGQWDNINLSSASGFGSIQLPCDIVAGQKNTSAEFELAQLRLWSRALPAATIQENMGSDVSSDANGLFAYWKCCEGEGNVLLDYGPYSDPENENYMDLSITVPGTTLTWSDKMYKFTDPNKN